MQEFRQKIKRLAKLLVEKKPAVIFTGAGMSTASGIPDFRSPNGLWSKVDPFKVASIDALRENPKVFYKFYKERLSTLLKAQPNEGHRILGKLEKFGFIQAVITQNIDGLHQKGGSLKVIELHGNIKEAHCMKCGHGISSTELLALLEESEVPYCNCGGVYKVDVVLFGEILPEKAILEATKLTYGGYPWIVLGSSLVVMPAADFPRQALLHGSQLVIVNKEPTYLDEYATILFHDNIVDVLIALEEELHAQGHIS
ncbi:MAG: NAD-dependent deacylase [Synergistetes bacterium]|nr:NAD-dependent deacylase [Synergistota bacterium]MCX8128214.1 NAD-dependent deacylase [Synergistota bacterium]MDW8192661.1 NAD-dependent deacylase [Synergistota bacterium]